MTAIEWHLRLVHFGPNAINPKPFTLVCSRQGSVGGGGLECFRTIIHVSVRKILGLFLDGQRDKAMIKQS